MKKFSIVVLSVACCLSLAACASSNLNFSGTVPADSNLEVIIKTKAVGKTEIPTN